MKIIIRTISEEEFSNRSLELNLTSANITSRASSLMAAWEWPSNPKEFNPGKVTRDEINSLRSVSLYQGHYIVIKARYNPDLKDGIVLLQKDNSYFVINEQELYHPRFKDSIELVFSEERSS